MARGGPDWYGQVGVTFGSINVAKGSGWADHGLTTNYITLSGRGQFLGGLLYADQGGDASFDKPLIEVDGVVLTDQSLYTLDRYQIDHAGLYPVYIITYNQIDYIYSVGFTPGFTFNESLKIEYFNFHAADENVWVRIFYSLII